MEKFDISTRITSYRQRIDSIDTALVNIVAERLICTDEIGLLKAEHNLPPVDKGREERHYARLSQLAHDAKLDQDFVKKLMKFTIGEVVQRHNAIAAERNAGRVITS